MIFLIALSDRGILDRAKRSYYIVKPFDNHDLLTAIELALEKHTQGLEKYSITIECINRICHEELTEREFEMLEDIVKGLTNK